MHLLLLLLACGPAATDDHAAGADSDTDSHTDSDTDADSDSDSDTDTDSDTDSDTDADAAWARVDPSGGVQERSVDVAVAPDGAAYVSWVDGSRVAWVRRSGDGGRTWDEAVAVNEDGTTASVTMARRPYVVTDGERVAVAFVDLGSTHVEAYVSSAGTLEFSHAATLGTSASGNDFAKPIFVDGDLVVEWQEYDPTGAMVLARESTGWTEQPVDDAIPGVPCECCPNDALVESSGQLVVAFRNNDDNLREHWVSMLPSGQSAQVTQTEGQLMSCPMEGPRLAEVTGTLLLVWADASMDGRTWVASSGDGVGTWSTQRDVMGRTGTSSPTIASSGGDVYITTEIDERSLLVKVTDEGATFGSPSELVSPSGTLGYAQVDAGGGVVIAAGSASDGSAWIYRP